MLQALSSSPRADRDFNYCNNNSRVSGKPNWKGDYKSEMENKSRDGHVDKYKDCESAVSGEGWVSEWED
jgi:hypothetical protein